MTKQFAMIVGWVLIIVGILNFFVDPIKLMPAHGVFHIVAGLLGVWAAKNMSKGYTMWVGVIGILLAVIGFFSKEVLGLIDMPTWITVVHAALGVLGLIVFMMAKRGPAKPAAPMTSGAPM